MAHNTHTQTRSHTTHTLRHDRTQHTHSDTMAHNTHTQTRWHTTHTRRHDRTQHTHSDTIAHNTHTCALALTVPPYTLIHSHSIQRQASRTNAGMNHTPPTSNPNTRPATPLTTQDTPPPDRTPPPPPPQPHRSSSFHVPAISPPSMELLFQAPPPKTPAIPHFL